MNPNHPLYLHAFNLLPEFGLSRLLKVAGHFENFQAAFETDSQNLMLAGVEAGVAEKFLLFRGGLDLETEMQKLRAGDIGLMSFKDSNFPKLLLEISKSPALLYFRGKMENAEDLCVAAVGSRKITNYGRVVTPQLIEPLAQSGCVIVSGLAFGVDAACHQAALNVHQRTIGILAGGIDEATLYPQNHLLLAQQILDSGGALISEYPCGTPALKHHFLARNRIISGMSVATVVIECDLKSGSLITAQYALEQGRALYAVPGPIYSTQSLGPNNLIKMGAKPMTSANDVLEDLNLQALPEQQTAQSQFGDTPMESVVLKMLGKEPVNINAIIKQSGQTAGEITSALTFLEMKGRVKNLGGQQYILSR